jgi:8-amino-3,8-dideoxy-alpha-D-manno-octulosonate transaminase
MNRRSFLAAAAAAAGSTSPAPAAEGRTPVRDTPLRSTYSGPEFYDEKELAELRDVLEKRQPFRWYGPGAKPPMKVLTLEKELAARMGTKFALAVTSGSAALTTALAALGVGPGDEVILPAWGWYSCFNAVVMNAALPVFAESDESFNLDPADVEAKITPQTRVIMVVHTMGSPADMDALMSIARRRGVKVLEDCAQSVGASYRGRPVGSIGDVGIYSFQIAKTITAGEGGGLVTSDPLLFERATRYHDIGLLRPPHQAMLGGAAALPGMIGNQYRMSEFTGGVLLAQLRKLDAIVGGFRRHARRVYEGIADLPALCLRHRHDPEGDTGSNIWLGFPSQDHRDRFLKGMRAENVPAATPLEVALLPLQPAIEQKLTTHPDWPSFTSPRGRAIRYGAECCPRTLAVHRRFAGVALDPKFSRRDVDDIITAIRKVWERLKAEG